MACFDATIKHDGNPPFVLVASIDHNFKDGCHIFTSEKIPGLLIIAQSKESAVAQLPTAIRSLFKRNRGKDCDVVLGSTEEGTENPQYAIISKAA